MGGGAAVPLPGGNINPKDVELMLKPHRRNKECRITMQFIQFLIHKRLR